MKKICLMLGALTLTSTAAFSHAYGGFYVGAGLGAGVARSEHKFTDATGQGKVSYTKVGGLYEFFTGYMQEVGSSRTMVGGEAYMTASTAKEKENLGTNGQPVVGTVTIKREPAYGVAAILGKLVNPKVMVYAKIAYEMAKYKLDYRFTGANAALSGVKKPSYNGVVPGAGVNYKINANLIVGAEYSFAGTYGKKKVIDANGVVCEFNPGEHRFAVRAAYIF